MDDKAKAYLGMIGVGVVGVVLGGLFVYMLMAPVQDSVPDVAVPGMTTDAGRPHVGDMQGSMSGVGDKAIGQRGVSGRGAGVPKIKDVSGALNEKAGASRPGLADRAEPIGDTEPNEFASLPKHEIWAKIKEHERAMSELGHKRAECMREIEVERKKAENDPEVVALKKAFEEKREILSHMLKALPGVAEHSARWTDLKKVADELTKRREEVGKGLRTLRASLEKGGEEDKTVDSIGREIDAYKKEMDALNLKIKDLEREMVAEQLATRDIQKTAREENGDVKTLTAELIEKQHLLEAKRNRIAGVSEARKKLQELDREYEAAAKKNSRLHKALMVPVSQDEQGT